MAGSLNKVMLIGNLGKDPEIRTMNNGNRVATFRIATSESWRDKTSGEKKERTEWHSIVIFNEKLVEIVEKYLAKGTKIYIEGALQTRKWEKDGQDHYSTEIVLQGFNGSLTMLSGKGDGGADGDRYSSHQREGAGGGGSGGDYASRRSSGAGTQESFAADLDDEIPFISQWSMW